MTYFMNSDDMTELKRIDQAIGETRKVHEEVHQDILNKIHEDHNFHDPRENLNIEFGTLIHRLDVFYRLQISFNGIHSFSKEDGNIIKGLKYHE